MRYSRKHIADHPLLERLSTSASNAHFATADFLADLAEVDLRQLYLPQGFSSIFAYCVSRLHLSEDSAYRHIGVARVARQFPEVFPAIADRRLSMAVVLMLAPRLNEENAHELLTAATHKTKAQAGQLLAQRYPRPDVPTRLRALPVDAAPEPPRTLELAPERAGNHPTSEIQLAPDRVVATSQSQLVPDLVEAATSAPPANMPRAKIQPLAPRRFSLQVTIDQEARDLLRLAQELSGHAVPADNIAEHLKRALRVYVAVLEKEKFAAARKPRVGKPQANPDSRHVPAAVKRDVWARDGAQCALVSDTGQRCEARVRLEFDHLQPYARGGRATVGDMRLLCRAHNQYTANQTYGASFMDQKRGSTG